MHTQRLLLLHLTNSSNCTMNLVGVGIEIEGQLQKDR